MRGSVVKRASGRYAVVLDVGRDPATGKRKQKWVSGFATKAAGEEHLVELLGKLNRGEIVDPDLTPLRDYLSAWLEARSDLAASSVETYERMIRNHVAAAPIGQIPIGKIRRAHVRSHEAELQRKGLAVASRGVMSAVLSRALGDAVEDELIQSNPCAGRKRNSERKQAKFTVWTATELRQLLEAASGDRLEALWRLAVATGARRGEIIGSSWLGFSKENRTLTISQQVIAAKGGAAIAPLKTVKSNRTVTLDTETVDVLEQHRRRQLLERDLAGDVYVDRDLVFCDEIGRPLSPQTVTGRFNELRDTAELRAGRLHDVRHSHATHLLTEGVPVHVVAARLGHASPTITLSTYAHLLPTSDERAAEVMARVLAVSTG